MTASAPLKTGLHLRVTDVPKLPSLFLFAFQVGQAVNFWLNLLTAMESQKQGLA